MSKKNDNVVNIVASALATYGNDIEGAKLAAAQAFLESGAGKSGLTTQYNNYFGIKGKGSAGSANMPTQEGYNGNRVNTNANFRAYNSPQESFADHKKFLETNSRYKNVLNAPTFAEKAAAVKQAGYATDPNYTEKLLNVYNTHLKDLFNDPQGVKAVARPSSGGRNVAQQDPQYSNLVQPQFDIGAGTSNLTPEAILSGAGIPQLNLPKGAPKLKNTDIGDAALKAAMRFDSKPKPANQIDEFLRGVGTGQPFTDYASKPNPGGETAFGLGSLVGGVGATLGAGAFGGLPAAVAGGGVFAKQAALEGGSPSEVLTRGALGALTTAVPGALGGTLLKRAATGAAIGGGTVAADEAIRRGFRGQPIDAGILTDPNVGFGAGFGGVVGALTRGKGKAAKSDPVYQGEVVQPKLLPGSGPIIDMLPGPDGVYRALSTSEPKRLSGGVLGEPKLLPAADPIKLLTGGTERITAGDRPGILKLSPAPKGTRLANDTGMMLPGGKTTQLPMPVVEPLTPKSRLSDAPIDTTPGAVQQPEVFTSPTLAKKYSQKLMVEKGVSPDEISIITKGKNSTVLVEPKTFTPEVQVQLDQLTTEYQNRIATIKQSVMEAPNSMSAEVVANKDIKNAFKEFQAQREQLINQGDVTQPVNAAKPEPTPPETIQPKDAAPIVDSRPSVARKGGMTNPGEFQTFASLPEMQQYAPGLFDTAFTKNQQATVQQALDNIQAKQAITFTYTPEHSRTSKLNTATVLPTHIDARLGNKVRLFGINSNGQVRGYTLARLKNGKPVEGVGINQIIGTSAPTQLHLQGADPAFQAERIMADERASIQKNFTLLKQEYPNDKFVDHVFSKVFDKETSVPDALNVMKEFDNLPEAQKAKYMDTLRKRKMC